MENVEADDVADRVGEQDDPQDRQRRERAHDARQQRGHDEEPAADDGRERRRSPEVPLHQLRAQQEQRGEDAGNEKQQVERQARGGHVWLFGTGFNILRRSDAISIRRDRSHDQVSAEKCAHLQAYQPSSS